LVHLLYFFGLNISIEVFSIGFIPKFKFGSPFQMRHVGQGISRPFGQIRFGNKWQSQFCSSGIAFPQSVIFDKLIIVGAVDPIQLLQMFWIEFPKLLPHGFLQC
jgi:hypothetical protein